MIPSSWFHKQTPCHFVLLLLSLFWVNQCHWPISRLATVNFCPFTIPYSCFCRYLGTCKPFALNGTLNAPHWLLKAIDCFCSVVVVVVAILLLRVYVRCFVAVAAVVDPMDTNQQFPNMIGDQFDERDSSDSFAYGMGGNHGPDHSINVVIRYDIGSNIVCLYSYQVLRLKCKAKMLIAALQCIQLCYLCSHSLSLSLSHTRSCLDMLLLVSIPWHMIYDLSGGMWPKQWLWRWWWWAKLQINKVITPCCFGPNRSCPPHTSLSLSLFLLLSLSF